MFALRRAAVRIASQPSRQLSTSFRSTPRVAIASLEKPILSRSFHQSWIRRADEEQKTPAEKAEASPAEAESASETVTSEPSASEQFAEVKEESIATPKAADAAASSSSAPASSSTVTDSLSGVADSVTDAAKIAAARATAAFGSSRADAKPGRILYVGNLFFEVTSAQLEQEFNRFGEITQSRVVTDQGGMSKGFGYIEFAQQDAADRACVELDQKVFQGRRMAVQYHVRREPRRTMNSTRETAEPTKTLFIGNMSYQMSDRDLNDMFRSIRDVLDVRVAIDRRSGQPRGFAHADFIDVDAAKKAKEFLEKKVVYGRQLRVDYSQSSSATRQTGRA